MTQEVVSLLGLKKITLGHDVKGWLVKESIMLISSCPDVVHQDVLQTSEPVQY